MKDENNFDQKEDVNRKVKDSKSVSSNDYRVNTVVSKEKEGKRSRT